MCPDAGTFQYETSVGTECALLLSMRWTVSCPDGSILLTMTHTYKVLWKDYANLAHKVNINTQKWMGGVTETALQEPVPHSALSTHGAPGPSPLVRVYAKHVLMCVCDSGTGGDWTVQA